MTHASFSTSRLRRPVAAAAALLAVLGSAPAAAAQVQPFIAGGITVPAGRLATPAQALPWGDVNPGFQVDGGLALGFANGALDVRLFGTYASMGRDFTAFNRDMERGGVALRLDGTSRVIGGGVAAVYYFPYQVVPGLSPYILGSGGIYRQRLTMEFSGADEVPGSDEERIDTRLGAGLGAGLILDTGRLRFFLESRVDALMEGGERPGYLVPVQLGVKLGPP